MMVDNTKMLVTYQPVNAFHNTWVVLLMQPPPTTIINCDSVTLRKFIHKHALRLLNPIGQAELQKEIQRTVKQISDRKVLL